MRKLVIASVLVLLVLMLGCAKETPVEDTQPIVPAEPEVEVTEPESESEPIVAVGGEVLSEITCDRESMIVSFRITNTADVDWYLEKVSLFDIPDKTPAKVSVTGRILNDLDVICGNAILTAGQSVTCTKEYDEATFSRQIRLTNGDDLGRLDYNTIRIQTPDVNEQLQFDC